MKKLILVVGILTQSYFGISQNLKVVNHKEIPNRVDFTNHITSFDNNNGELYGLFFGYNQLNGNSRPFSILKLNKNTLEVEKTIGLNLPPRPYSDSEIEFMKKRQPLKIGMAKIKLDLYSRILI